STLSEQLINQTNSTQTEINFKIQQIILKYSILISTLNENLCENFDQIILFIKNFQNRIKEMQSSFDTYRNQIKNEHLTKMEE
ncbi:unnamed protein product, partial [Rotaria sp. Silwood1]